MRRVLPRLKRLFRYREYRHVAKFSSDCPLGARRSFELPGQASLDLTPERLEANRVLMRVLLREGGQAALRTGILAAPESPAVLGAPRGGDAALIVVIWAKPAP